MRIISKNVAVCECGAIFKTTSSDKTCGYCRYENIKTKQTYIDKNGFTRLKRGK